MKTLIRILPMLILAATFVFPSAVFGEVDAGRVGASTDRTLGNAPPLEQPLVPEGAFAVQLVQALNLGKAEDEAQAENMLSAVGIEAQNGWIAQYPVTPPIVAEIEAGIAGAADAGKLRMGKEQALRAVAELKNKLGLSITPGAAPAAQPAPPASPGNGFIYKYTDKYGIINFTDRYESIPQEYRARTETIQQSPHPQAAEPSAASAEIAGPAGVPEGQPAAPNPPVEVVNDYYNNPGPPAVTYYVPPPDYYYLYSWVPYPFWWSGFYFGGFFILNDFHRHVSFHGQPCIVSNHSFPPGRYQSHSAYPAGRGRSSRPTNSPQVFRAPAAPSGAKKIYPSTQNRKGPAVISKAPGVKNRAPVSITRSPLPAARPVPVRAYGQAVQSGRTVAPSPRTNPRRPTRPPAPGVRPSPTTPAPTAGAAPASRARGYRAPSFSSEGYSPPATISRGSFGWSRPAGAGLRSGSFGGYRGGLGGYR